MTTRNQLQDRIKHHERLIPAYRANGEEVMAQWLENDARRLQALLDKANQEAELKARTPAGAR